MKTGVSGYFDISGSYGMTLRTYYEEQYDEAGAVSVLSITAVQLQSTQYKGPWYPGTDPATLTGRVPAGCVSVNGASVSGAISHTNPATHAFSFDGASSSWIGLSALTGSALPWASAEIAHDASGEATATITVDFTIWRDSSAPKPDFYGTHTVTLTKIQTGLVDIENGSTYKKYRAVIDNGSTFKTYRKMIDNGESWVAS